MNESKVLVRKAINSEIWNILVALAIIVNMVFWFLDLCAVQDIEHLEILMDVIVFLVFFVDVAMRISVSKVNTFFALSNNRTSLVIAIVSFASLIVHARSDSSRLDLIQGLQIGAMTIRLMWVSAIISPAFSSQEQEPHAVRCLRTLETLRDRLGSGFDTELGLRVEDVNFVIEAINGDNLYSNRFDKAIQDPNLDVDQGNFLRAVFSDSGAVQTKEPKKDSQRPSIVFNQSVDSPYQDKLIEVATDWDFDAFTVHKLSETLPPLVLVGHHVFTQLGLSLSFGIEDKVLLKWLSAVNEAYLDNPYHNSTHACDILQIVFFHFTKCGFGSEFSALEVLACVVAAIVHDMGHVGVTNGFLKMTFHELAIRYNDAGILENMHVSEGWMACTNPRHNIFENLTVEQRRVVRELMIAMVLDTDMARHSKITEQFAAKLHQGFNLTQAEDRKIVLSMLLHCADLGNGVRNFDIAKKWGEKVMEEFFNQGDREKELSLPVTANMDRDGGIVLVAKCQMTFLNYVVSPLYKEWCDFLRYFADKYSFPPAAKYGDQFQLNIKKNIETWDSIHKELLAGKDKNIINMPVPSANKGTTKAPQRNGAGYQQIP
eukprot:c16195_g1_i1.p1 GENE.c16195_g1_i1~~c16195_g1_i1.p1  ORF type:complete len:601 (-),score=221.56 c16195_g1_i1:35-1837(-)